MSLNITRVREHVVNSNNEFEVIHRESSGDLIILEDDSTVQDQMPPNVAIGTITHGLRQYPICTLYTAHRTAGMGGAGEGGAGGGSIRTVPSEFELDGFDKVTVIAIAKYESFTDIYEINSRTFSFVDSANPDNLDSLFLVLNTGAFERINNAVRVSGGGNGGDDNNGINGTSNHAQLTNLEFARSGHTGLQFRHITDAGVLSESEINQILTIKEQ